MFARRAIPSLLAVLAAGLLSAAAARADEEAPLVLKESTSLQAPQATPVVLTPLDAAQIAAPITATPAHTPAEATAVDSTLDKALSLLGIRYRWGGNSPTSGFDCSGFVRYVFREGLGLDLPRSAKAISETGEPVAMSELKPGDLVFFKTMRRAFSHVGIYLGDNLFVHSPHRGARVRIEDMSGRYWTKRFNGARRVAE